MDPVQRGGPWTWGPGFVLSLCLVLQSEPTNVNEWAGYEIDHFKNRDVLCTSFIFRLTYYKTAGNTSVLGVAGSVNSMCGDTLKLLL